MLGSVFGRSCGTEPTDSNLPSTDIIGLGPAELSGTVPIICGIGPAKFNLSATFEARPWGPRRRAP